MPKVNNAKTLSHPHHQTDDHRYEADDLAGALSTTPSSSNNSLHHCNSSNNSGEEETIQYHPISCLNCKRMHKKVCFIFLKYNIDYKKCSKQLPSCSQCQLKGIECKYSEPANKKKNTELNHNINNINNIQLINENIKTNNPLLNNLNQINHLSKRNVIDLYFLIICYGNPIIKRQLLEDVILNNKTSNEGMEKEITCLFYSIQALCEQRCGFTELSEKSANKARNLLSKIFDFHTNYYVACTYVYLALFEASNGRYRNARYYLHSSNFYFSEKSTALNEDEMTLAKIRIFVSFLCNNEYTAQQTPEFDISNMMKELPHMFYMATGKILPDEWNYLIFGEDVTSQNFTKQLKAAEAISGTAHKKLRETVPKEFIQTRGYNLCDTSFTIIVNGLRIGILSKVNCGKHMIEESALKITYCTQVDAFSLFPPNMITYIIVATRIHLQIVKQIINGQRVNNQMGLDINGNYSNIDYFDILKRDLRALKLLESRYKRVTLIYGNFIREIEDLVYLQHSNNLNNSAKTSHSNVLRIHETSITFFDDQNVVYQAPTSEIYEGKLNNIQVVSKLPQSMMFRNTLRGNNQHHDNNTQYLNNNHQQNIVNNSMLNQLLSNNQMNTGTYAPQLNSGNLMIQSIYNSIINQSQQTMNVPPINPPNNLQQSIISDTISSQPSSTSRLDLQERSMIEQTKGLVTATNNCLIVDGGEPFLLEEDQEEPSLFEDDNEIFDQNISFALENNSENVADILDPFLTNEELDTIFASSEHLLIDEDEAFQ